MKHINLSPKMDMDNSCDAELLLSCRCQERVGAGARKGSIICVSLVHLYRVEPSYFVKFVS